MSTQQQSSTPSWVCDVCTYINDIDAKICICNNTNPQVYKRAAASREMIDAYICGTCSRRTPNSSEVCNSCMDHMMDSDIKDTDSKFILNVVNVDPVNEIKEADINTLLEIIASMNINISSIIESREAHEASIRDFIDSTHDSDISKPNPTTIDKVKENSTAINSSDRDYICVACTEEYVKTDSMEGIQLNQCSHTLCNPCVERWFLEQSDRCPACRLSINK